LRTFAADIASYLAHHAARFATLEGAFAPGSAGNGRVVRWFFPDIMAYVIAEPCIGTKDTACVDACPVDCIHPKKDAAKFADAEMLYIDPVECIDCGACVPVCPVSAIFALDDLPEKWTEFTEKNAAFFGR
jgi:NAD-dependent dihydropyrimidine dehydrogenase PreA subunit